jgi:hypothetical protein
LVLFPFFFQGRGLGWVLFLLSLFPFTFFKVRAVEQARAREATARVEEQGCAFGR